MALVQRDGRVRIFHVVVVDRATVEKIVSENIAHESRLHTDESKLHFNAANTFVAHKTVKHSAKQCARHDLFMVDDATFGSESVHCNTAEGYFSIFKRGMKGIYQHCDETHPRRHLAEYDFRYNHRIKLGFDEADRTVEAIKGLAGKRLLYPQPH